MNISEIPLSPDNQQFNIAIAGENYAVRVLWRDNAGWILDLLNNREEPVIPGIPLVTGADLMEQYQYLALGFSLYVICDDETQDYPTKTDLGSGSHLYIVTE